MRLVTKAPTSKFISGNIMPTEKVPMFETSRKDFGTIAKALNRSVASVLAQYYYWKSMEKKQGKGAVPNAEDDDDEFTVGGRTEQ